MIFGLRPLKFSFAGRLIDLVMTMVSVDGLLVLEASA